MGASEDGVEEPSARLRVVVGQGHAEGIEEDDARHDEDRRHDPIETLAAPLAEDERHRESRQHENAAVQAAHGQRRRDARDEEVAHPAAATELDRCQHGRERQRAQGAVRTCLRRIPLVQHAHRDQRRGQQGAAVGQEPAREQERQRHGQRRQDCDQRADRHDVGRRRGEMLFQRLGPFLGALRAHFVPARRHVGDLGDQRGIGQWKPGLLGAHRDVPFSGELVHEHLLVDVRHVRQHEADARQTQRERRRGQHGDGEPGASGAR